MGNHFVATVETVELCWIGATALKGNRLTTMFCDRHHGKTSGQDGEVVGISIIHDSSNVWLAGSQRIFYICKMLQEFSANTHSVW